MRHKMFVLRAFYQKRPPETCIIFLLNHADLTHIMATSRDWDELSWAWEGWREASGNTMPEAFEELFELQNEAADINGLYFVLKKCLY